MHSTAVSILVLQIVLPLGDEPSKRSGKNPKQDSQAYPITGKKITSQTGEVGIVRRSPDMDALKQELKVSHASIVTTHQPKMGRYYPLAGMFDPVTCRERCKSGLLL